MTTKLDTYSAPSLLRAAGIKNMTIQGVVPISAVQRTIIHLTCNLCHATFHPSAKSFISRMNSKCKCVAQKTEPSYNVKDSDWAVIRDISGSMAEHYHLHDIAPYYQVSRDGQIRNAHTGKMLTLHSLMNESGYQRTSLITTSDKTGTVHILVHVIVACAFIPFTDPDTIQVDHIDNDKTNNRVSNLRWSTPSDNCIRRTHHGRQEYAEMTMWFDGHRIFYKEEDCKTSLFPNMLTPYVHTNYKQRLDMENEMKIDGEEWRECTVDSNPYRVSNFGRVMLVSYNKASFGSHVKDSYVNCMGIRVHILIATAFLDEQRMTKQSMYPDKPLFVNHKDGCKYHNHVSNLEWVTTSENIRHAQEIGMKPLRSINKYEWKTENMIIKVGSYASIQLAVDDMKDVMRKTVEYHLRNNMGVTADTRPSIHTDKSHKWVWFYKNEMDVDAFTFLPKVKAVEYDTDPTNAVDISPYYDAASGELNINLATWKELKSHPGVTHSLVTFFLALPSPMLSVNTNKQVKETYDRLVSSKDTIFTSDEGDLVIESTTIGLACVNRIMNPYMIKARPKGHLSFEDAWSRKDIVERLVTSFSKETSVINSTMFNCYSKVYGRVYNFPPCVAKGLYNHFGAKRVLDFCSGYGGRLTGFWASNAESYVGIDPNTDLHVPYGELLAFLSRQGKKECRMMSACAEDVDYRTVGSFDFVMTSPPYFNTEIYSDEDTQSCHRYPEIDKWLKSFLFETLSRVADALDSKGHIVINIKDSAKNAIVEPMKKHLVSLGLLEKTPIIFKQPKMFRNNVNYERFYVFQKT